MRYVVLVGLALSTSAFAQQPDRKDDLTNVLRASRDYSEQIAATCLADARKQLGEKDAEISKLKADLEATKKPVDK